MIPTYPTFGGYQTQRERWLAKLEAAGFRVIYEAADIAPSSRETLPPPAVTR
jgi:hypothetical protein